MVEEATVDVLVVPVSWVSQGGLEQTRVTVPGVSPDDASAPDPELALGWSEVGEAIMETGRSWTGWASTPLGVVIRVTWIEMGQNIIYCYILCLTLLYI